MNDPENMSDPDYDKEHYLQEIKNAYETWQIYFLN